MVDAFVADLASGLVRKIISLATEEVIQAWNLCEDLATLRERLEAIDALLSDTYTKKLAMSSVQNWINKLQAVAHIADVFMDELAYEATRHKVENHHIVRDFFVPSKNSILYRFKVAYKIKSIHISLDKIFKWAIDIGLKPVAHLSSSVQHRETRHTPPFEDESRIVGRDKDASYLVRMVSESHEENLLVISVAGMGGQGKTTLARMVYNKDVVINIFPKRMWVTVSYEFDFMKILNQMVGSLTSTSSMLDNAEALIKNLKKHLEGVKFLLVLDDVWNEKAQKWDNLMNSLLGVGCAKGSIILVTTRNQEVIDAMQCSVGYWLEKLSEEDSWALFKQRAFLNGGVLETQAFVALGRRMVERCGGLPLAIKTLAGLLYSKKSEEEWLLIQNSEVWKSKGVLSSLRLSYDNLPYSSLKRCFACCSIIPKDSPIYKDELVQIWMALGFLLPPGDSSGKMEDVGNEYFNILLSHSLLQDVERDEYGNITYCKMHDLVHDLAQDVSTNYSMTVTPSQDSNQLSKAIYARPEGFEDLKPNIYWAYFDTVRGLNSRSGKLKHLTVLVLKSFSNEMPSSIGNLKYLKYLDISSFLGYKTYKLPNYISRLYNLQTLRVSALHDLPEKVCNLINLRHLVIEDKYADRNPRRRFMFVGIERLTCLQTLPHFVVSRDQNCLIGQLRGLKNIRGNLKLYNLGDVVNMEEARKAKLCQKPIQHLLLDWSNNDEEREDRESNDENVMNGLEPHTYLKELTIDNYMGKTFASWITMMENLVKITLRCCNRCEEFPQLGHLPKLREMKIVGMDNVKAIGSDIYGGLYRCSSDLSSSGIGKQVTIIYPSLRKLILRGLTRLEELLEPEVSIEDQSRLVLFPKLEVLDIKNCSKLTRIPRSFPSLKELGITNLDSSMIIDIMSRKIRSLTHLRLSNISGGGGASSYINMDSVIDELLKNNSQSLTTLNLYDCQGLTSLTLGITLENLKVVNCSDLTSINVVEESSALNYLIFGCPILEERCWKGDGIQHTPNLNG